MIAPPYLREQDLHPDMNRRPSTGFFLKAGDFRVVDGDTFAVLAPGVERGRRPIAFKIRLNSVNTPEMPTTVPQQKILIELGLDPHSGHPGSESTKAVRKICEGRAIYVEPAKGGDGKFTDRYGRLLASICVSGSPGKLFDANGAIPLENWLLSSGHGHQMEGRRAPSGVPLVISRLLKEIREGAAPDGPRI